MTPQKAKTILTNHNKWRHDWDGGEIKPTDPETLGEALDVAVEALENLTAAGLASFQETCHQDAMKSGWWPEVRNGQIIGPETVPAKLCLIHSEVSEAMEGHRKDLMDDKIPHRKMFEVELADAMIRIADLAGATGCDLAGAVTEKLEYNRARADHTPENRAKEGGKKY